MCEETGKELEPTEEVLVDVPGTMAGLVVEKVQTRGGTLTNMVVSDLVGPDGEDVEGRARVEFLCPSRGLIGLRGELMRECRGEAVMNTVLHSYTPMANITKAVRKGAIISMADGIAKPHSLEALESRGILFIEPQKPVYNGQVVGESSVVYDVEVNPTKQKALTNFRAAGKEDFVRLAAPRQMTLEEYIGYIADDELIEVTPDAIRLRKKVLDPSARARDQRGKANKLKER
jgi:GTP-binding protein